ncbi:MAG: hypothetical protein LR017_01630 [Candidatus Pacebacteria bacterium]|nr:hypothetical protein [Candidatus Paceibacterota bacterium]
MHITIATPLFPPDQDETARYTKTLAASLGKEDTISVLLYGSLPESVTNTALITISKNTPLPIRMFSFAWKLIFSLKKTDMLYVINGPSVEFPVLLASYIRNIPIILIIADMHAHTTTIHNSFTHQVHRALVRRSVATVSAQHSMLVRPVLHPLENYPTTAMEAYERSWKNHLMEIKNKSI